VLARGAGNMKNTGQPPGCLLVTQMFPPAVGGSGVLLENVYARLRGISVTALVDRATCGAPVHPSLTIVPTSIDPGSWGVIRPRSWRGHWRLARQISALSRDGRAVVHCGRSQPEGVPALLASAMPRGAPYVFWAHGEDVAASLSSREFAFTMRLVYRGASAALANSRNTARLIEATGWFGGTVDVVYPGVDSSRFHPTADDGSLRRRLLASDHDILLLSVARLQRRKGHDLVIRALPALRRTLPDIRYVIVGDGPERENLSRLSAELAVSECVIFAGEVPDSELPSYYSASDIFVLPTRVHQSDFEGFGIVFLEAAASGKPVVAGRNGGVPEAVLHGQTGLLVEEDDLEGLTSALLDLCGSEFKRRQLGERGRIRAATEFTWDSAAQRVEEIQARVAARHNYHRSR
jgi:phosphatidylinositol alpha-1,6-mannosyltransferase